MNTARFFTSRLFWLWLPLGFLVIQSGFEFFLPHEILAPLHSETGPHELIQFFIISAAFLVALSVLRMINPRQRPWFFSWVILAALCSLYVAGEEITWGQHVLGWTTPEFWSQVNDQNETNLHNTSSWLDQKPPLPPLGSNRSIPWQNCLISGCSSASVKCRNCCFSTSS